MILRDGDDGESVVAIAQTSHAWLSGQLARAWGNARFARPAPWEELCLGAEQHDVGMAMLDLEPPRDAATGLPVQYFALDRPTHVGLWSRAPLRLLGQSRHAALLVSLHGTGLYERFPPKDPPPDVAALVDGFLADQRALQARLAGELGLGAAELHEQQQLMAVWDDVSLALCHGQDRRAGHELVLAVRGEADGTHTVDPWPFGAERVAVRCEGRVLAPSYPDAAALRAAHAAARTVTLRFTLRPR